LIGTKINDRGCLYEREPTVITANVIKIHASLCSIFATAHGFLVNPVLLY